MNNKYINNKDNNLSGSFPSKTPKDIKKKSGILMAVLPLAACGGGSSGGGGVVTVAPPAPPTPDYVESPTNVFVASSNVNPTLDKASSTADITVTGNNTNDTITTGSGADKIRAGEGADNINAGSGDDVIILVGTTTANQYENTDIINAGGVYNLSDIITLGDLNNRSVSEVTAGEIIDGGTGNNMLIIYGDVDLTGVTFTNVTVLEVHSEVTLTLGQLKQFTSINGDGGSVINIEVPNSSSTTYTLDLRDLNVTGINKINIDGDLTIKISDITDLRSLGDYGLFQPSETSNITLEIIDDGVDVNLSMWEIGVYLGSVQEIILDDQVYLWLDDDFAAEISAFIYNGLNSISGNGTIKYLQPTQDYLADVTVESSIKNDPNGSIRIEGAYPNPVEGQTLAVVNTLSDDDGLGTISYQWQRGGTDISGANASTYTITQSDVGSAITVVASYTDGEGTSETVTSAATSPVSDIPVINLSDLDGTKGFRLDGV
ncbi:hypothetical protein N8742_08050, partial [Emcibacteraceae bacterium]|nr:hypothetical protein [Emcibacteraceae bacterium]